MSVSREQKRPTQLALLTPRALVRHFWFCSASISQTHRQLTEKHRAISNNKRQIQIQITERSQRLIFYQPYPGLRLLSPMHPCSLGEPPPPPAPTRNSRLHHGGFSLLSSLLACSSSGAECMSPDFSHFKQNFAFVASWNPIVEPWHSAKSKGRSFTKSRALN